MHGVERQNELKVICRVMGWVVEVVVSWLRHMPILFIGFDC